VIATTRPSNRRRDAAVVDGDTDVRALDEVGDGSGVATVEVPLEGESVLSSAFPLWELGEHPPRAAPTARPAVEVNTARREIIARVARGTASLWR
jgi:hypothetical protein